MNRFIHREVRIMVKSIIERADGTKAVGYTAEVYSDEGEFVSAELGASVPLGKEITVLLCADGRFAINGSPAGMPAPTWDFDDDEPTPEPLPSVAIGGNATGANPVAETGALDEPDGWICMEAECAVLNRVDGPPRCWNCNAYHGTGGGHATKLYRRAPSGEPEGGK